MCIKNFKYWRRARSFEISDLASGVSTWSMYKYNGINIIRLKFLKKSNLAQIALWFSHPWIMDLFKIVIYFVIMLRDHTWAKASKLRDHSNSKNLNCTGISNKIDRNNHLRKLLSKQTVKYWHLEKFYIIVILAGMWRPVSQLPSLTGHNRGAVLGHGAK